MNCLIPNAYMDMYGLWMKQIIHKYELLDMYESFMFIHDNSSMNSTWLVYGPCMDYA